MLGTMVGNESTKYKEKGLNPQDVFKYSLMSGTAQAFLESGGNLLQLGRLGQFFKGPAKNAWSRAAKAIGQISAAEGLEEVSQEVAGTFFDFMSEAPPGNTQDQIAYATERTAQDIKDNPGKYAHAAAAGVVGGAMLGGAPIAGVAAKDAVVKTKEAIGERLSTEEKDFLKQVPIATKQDVKEVRNVVVDPAVLSSGISEAEAVKSKEANQVVDMKRQAADVNLAAANEAKMEEERKAAEAHEQEVAQAKQEEAQAIKAAQTNYSQHIAHPANLLEQAGSLDSKPLNEAHKAIVIDEDNVKKLKGIAYDLRYSKDVQDGPYEIQATAEGMAYQIDQKVQMLEAEQQLLDAAKAGVQTEGQRLAEEFGQEQLPESVKEKLAEEEAVVEEEPAPTTDIFDTFAEDAIKAKKERVAEEKAEKELKEQEAAEEPVTKKAFGRRRFARRRAAGISEADSKAMDKAFAEQRAKAPIEPPKDLKAALKLEDGTILTGTSHYEILGNLTDEQIEQVDFANVKRGFASSADPFLTVDESTAKYGVTKSQQIPTVKKLTPTVTRLAEKKGKKLELIARERLGILKGALTKEQAVERVNQIPKKYTKDKKIVVVGTAAELAPEVRAEIGDVAAIYHVTPGQKLSEGTIYVVADRTASKAGLMANVWHEMGHQGLAKLAKDSGKAKDLSSFLKDIKKNFSEDVKDVQDLYGLSEDVAAEEVLIREFEKATDKGLVARFKKFLRSIMQNFGIKVAKEDEVTAIIDSLRRVAAGNTIRFGQKGYTEARDATAEGMAVVRKALKPVMIKQAIKTGALRKESVKISEFLNEAQKIDEKLRVQIAEQVFRGEEDIAALKKLIAKGKKKPATLVKRQAEVDRAKEYIKAGKIVTQSRKTNVTNYNAALQNSPELMAAVKAFQKKTGVPILDANGELASAPIEQRQKPGNGRFDTLPKFGGFSRSLTQTYLDRMAAPEREAFRKDMITYIEQAYEDGSAPKTFNIGLQNIGGTDYNIAAAVRSANKTEGAINLNGMCPMFYVGSHGCYFDGCYVTGIGKGATNVNVHDSALYTGEILQLDQESIDNLNEVGGLRMNGIGDTALQDYGQWKDVYKHAAMRGLKLKVITKQEATFEIIDRLMRDSDKRIASKAAETVIQPSLDPYWIPVEEDGRKGSFATEMGITGKPETSKAVIRLYKSIGRDAKLINGVVHRKYGFSGEQLKGIAKKYPKIKIQPRVVVGTTREIAEFALNQPEVLQTWMHAKVRPGMFSDVHGRTLGPDEVGNFEDRIEIKKDMLGEWVIEAQEASGKVVKNARYTAVESYIKENYSKADADKIFSTLAGQTKKDPGALCCTSGASKNACNNCTSTCATGTYHSGKDVEDLATRNEQMARFVDVAVTEPNMPTDTSMPTPNKTVVAYKLAKVKKSAPGKLFPLFVGANTPFEFNKWVKAEVGPAAKGGKVKSKIGPLAFRPGWHAGDSPQATHIGGREKGEKAPTFRKDDEVWVEVELPADVDWQTVANERAKVTKTGKPNLATAHITDQIPEGGFYRYKTNANMTGEWLISGGMKVNRILTDAEVDAINKKAGRKDLPRKKPFDPKTWGLDTKLYQTPSEAADTTIVKKATQPIKKGEIVKPRATEEVSDDVVTEGITKKAYQPHFALKEVTDHTELIQRTFLQERRRQWVDQYDVLKQLEKGQDIDDTMSGYKSQTLISNLPAMLDTFLEYGNIDMVENWMRVEKGGKGLAPIISELGENASPFFERLTAKSGQELLDNYGKQRLWGADDQGNPIDDQGKIDEIMSDTQALYDANKKQWDAAEARLREINKDVTDFMRDAGLISEEEHSQMRKTYIPFFRQIEDVYGQEFETLVPKKGKTIKTTKTLKGNDQLQLGDPLNNLISAYSFFINESLRNLTRTKTLKLAKDLELIERVHKGQKGGPLVVDIRVKGEPVHYRVKNGLLYEALTNTAQSKVNLPDIIRAPKRWLTWGVTVMPRFRAFNIIRDTLSAAFMNKSIIPFIDTYRGFIHSLRRSPEFVKWTSTGGNFTGSYSKRDVTISTQKGIEKLKKKLTRGKRNGVIEFASAMGRLWERLGEISESANRMGVFIAEQRKGASVTKAAFESRDLLDFHRKGAGQIAQFLIQTVPFLNARLQGLDKMARSAKGANKKRFWTAAMIMTLSSLALHFINEDNEDYKKLSDWEKIAYWHFYIGDEHFRIPTPFEVGSIFGAMPLAMAETVRGDRDALELYHFTKAIVLNTFAFNPIPQLFKPFLEQYVNWDFFRGMPIEGMRDEGVEPELRFNAGTGATAKYISKHLPKFLDFGPKRIEKFLRDWLGGFGDATMNMLDMATQHLDTTQDPAGKEMDSVMHALGVEGFWPSVKASKEPAYTKYNEKYYELKAEAEMAYNSMRTYADRLTDTEMVKKQGELEPMLEVMRILKPYTKDIRKVQADLRMMRFQGLSRKQQLKETERLLKERNRIMMQAVTEAKQFLKNYERK
ncbi:MAG: LPD38 domain-containing protein [Planctomycetota bacterium]